jgi:hypothetical protein
MLVEFIDIQICDIGVDYLPFEEKHFFDTSHAIDDVMFEVFRDAFS